jgi:hypothetical protein
MIRHLIPYQIGCVTSCILPHSPPPDLKSLLPLMSSSLIVQGVGGRQDSTCR